MEIQYEVNKIIYNRLRNIGFLRIWAGDKEYVIKTSSSYEYEVAEAAKTIDSKSLLIVFRNAGDGGIVGFLEIFNVIAIEARRIKGVEKSEKKRHRNQ